MDISGWSGSGFGLRASDCGLQASGGGLRVIPWRILSLIAIALAIAAPAFAQGRGNGRGDSAKNTGRGSPPSRSVLPTPVTLAGPAGATPFAWIDDATLLEPGVVWLGVSAVRWQGTGQNEIEAPVVDAAVGFSRRLQIGASVPHVMASADSAGVIGGLGTTYLNAKVSVYARDAFRLAVAPTLQLVNKEALVGTSDGRARWGLPVNVEYQLSERARVYGGSGYFSRGVWFAGGGGSVRVASGLYTSLSFSSAWTSHSVLTTLAERRNELTAGTSYALTSSLGLFGSVGRTLATTDASGAGTTWTGGMSVTFGPVAIH